MCGTAPQFHIYTIYVDLPQTNDTMLEYRHLIISSFFWHTYCIIYSVAEKLQINHNLKNKKMKKVLVSLAVMMGLCSVVIAQTSQIDGMSTKTEIALTQTEDDVYKEVKLEDLNQKVQETINGYTEAYKIKSLAYMEEKKVTKVTLTANADGSEKEVLLDDEGKEI